MNHSCIFIGFGKQGQEYANVFKKLNIKISSIFVRNKKKYFRSCIQISSIEATRLTCCNHEQLFEIDAKGNSNELQIPLNDLSCWY